MTNQLQEIRLRLLDLHRALIAVAREDHERLNGRMTGAAFWEVLTNDPAFAWLRPLTAFIVTMDEMLDSKTPLLPADRVECVLQARQLLAPAESGNEFQRRYADALQQSPEVVVAHAAVMRAL